MERIELELRELMAGEAATATDLPPLRQTLGRARRRRAGAAAVAGALAVAAVVGGVAGVGAITRDHSPPADSPPVVAPPSGDESFEFTSTPGTGDVVATGEFRGASWELTATPVEGDVAEIDLAFEVWQGDSRETSGVTVMASDAAIAARGLAKSYLLGDAVAVYGALRDDVANVDVTSVWIGEQTYAPHRFAGPDGELTVDYFLAFIPREGEGFVSAYDEAGIVIGESPFAGATAESTIARGRSGDDPWGVEFSGDGAGRACIVFYAGDDGPNGDCLTKGEIADGGPMSLLTFEESKVLGLVGIISEDVGFVRLVTDDGTSHDLPWFSPPDDERAEWPLRLVAVGVEPGTSGLLRVFDGQGNVIDEQPVGRQTD